jgi:hypothetical protein
MAGDHEKEETLPPGFRFHPTDEELITYYLINKISDPNFTGKAIGDVDLNKCEPWELPGTCNLKPNCLNLKGLTPRSIRSKVQSPRVVFLGHAL